MEKTIKAKFENVGNERAIISCILKHPNLIIDADAKLLEADFLSDHHRAFYSIIRDLYLKGIPKFDLVAIINSATDKGVLELIGGPDYINALFNASVDKDNIDFYIDKVLDSSTKYKLYLAANAIKIDVMANIGSSEVKPSAALIAEAEAKVMEVSLEAERIEDAVDLAEGLVARLEALKENPVDIAGLSTGFALFDKLINGLTPNSLTVIAARSKVGKSIFLMNIAAHLSYRLNKPVLYLDTEMRDDEVQLRLISHMAKVPEKEISTGRFANNDRYLQRIDKATRVINKGDHLYHKFVPGFSIDAINSMARKYKARYDIAALFFDYIKLPESSNLNNAKEHQYLGFLAAALKNLSGTLNIPVVTAAQINRDGARASKQYSDAVAGSDRILHYCTALCALSRKSTEEMEADPVDEYGIPKGGTHRLQILDARSNGQFFEGINLVGNLPSMSFREAQLQVPGMMGEPSVW